MKILRFTTQHLAAALIDWESLPKVARSNNIPEKRARVLLKVLQEGGPGRIMTRLNGGANHKTTEYRWTPESVRLVERSDCSVYALKIAS